MKNEIQNNMTIVERIKQEIERMRPFIQEDGGDVAFVGFDEATGVVEVELQGHCVGCPLSQITLKQGLEESLRLTVPAVKEVNSV